MAKVSKTIEGKTKQCYFIEKVQDVLINILLYHFHDYKLHTDQRLFTFYCLIQL